MSFSSFDISASGMHAQKVKMNTIASNIANINTTRNPDGSPGVYVRKDVTFKAIYQDRLGSTAPAFPDDERELAQGVEVAEITNSPDPYKTIYDPSNPEADEDGFVTLPNINIVEEMVNMVTASRAYEANSATAETTKGMITAAMRI